MSYILDALRKVERERKLGQAPTLHSMSVQQVLPQRVVWPWWLVASLVIISAAAIVAVQRWQQQPLQITSTPASETIELPVPVDTEQSALVTAKQQLEQPLIVEPVAPQLSVSETQRLQQPIRPLPEISAEIPAELPAEIPAPVTLPQRAPLPVVTEPSPVTIAEQPLVLAAAPLLQTLPDQFQRTVGPLNLDIHIYSDVPGQRFVVINGRRYKQADWLHEGPLLEAITREGVILSHREQRFRLAVQR